MNSIIDSEVKSLRDFEAAYVMPLVEDLHCRSLDMRDYIELLINDSDNLNAAVEAYNNAFGEDSGFEEAVDKLVMRDLRLFPSEGTKSAFYRYYSSYSPGLTDETLSYKAFVNHLIDSYIDHAVDGGYERMKVFDQSLGLDGNNSLYLPSELNEYGYLAPSLKMITLGNVSEDIRGNSWQPVSVSYIGPGLDNRYIESDMWTCEIGLLVPINNGELDVSNSQYVFDIDVDTTMKPSEHMTLLNCAMTKALLGSSHTRPFFDENGECTIGDMGTRVAKLFTIEKLEPLITQIYSNAGDNFTIDAIDTFDWDKLSEFSNPVIATNDTPAASSDVSSDLEQYESGAEASKTDNFQFDE